MATDHPTQSLLFSEAPIKRCCGCGEMLPLSRFYSSGKGRVTSRCDACVAIYRRSPKMKDWIRNYHQSLRQEMIAAYGGACVCCGENRWENLTLDHVGGGGQEDRGGRRGAGYFLWLRSQGWPREGLVLLCWNCNLAKGFYGACPHQQPDIYLDRLIGNNRAAIKRRHKWNLRLKMIAAYGGCCHCCGEATPHFLVLDHLNGGGNQERNRTGGTVALLMRLKRQGWPKEDYALSCHNHNCSRGISGRCPHCEADRTLLV